MAFTAKDADPGALPTVGGWVLGASSGAHALLAVQFLMAWYLGPFQWIVVMAMLVGGALGVFLAVKLGQGRSWAAIVGALLSPALGLLSLGFSAYAAWNLTFAVYMLVAPPAALLATLVVPFTILPCRRAEQAAAELRQRYTTGPFAGML